jgi:S1-C subfamily serine protease
MQNVTVQSTSQATFDVESSEEHFAIINIVNGMTPVLEPVTKEVFDENRLKAKSIFKYQESKEFPINRASITANKKDDPGQGTGFLVNKEGYLLTNFHVIDKAKKITVKGIHGDFSISFEAQVVGTDSRTDLALLRINSKLISFPEPPYAFVSTKGVQQGESVVALGYPIKQVMGEEVKVTSGIINAKSGYKGAISEYQFSAAVQPGNSGGPLLNGAGQVIGMVSAKLDADVAESVGYAVKADHLMFFLDQFDSVTYRKDETSGAAKPLPEIVSTNSPFVYIIETD